jgi:hypothetical protein
MRRTPAWLAILATAALVLGACSGDDGSDDEPASESTATSPGVSEPADSTPPTKAELRSALLTLEDMPAGWSVGDYDPESDDNLCPAEIAGPLGLEEEPMSVGVQYAGNLVQGPSFSEAIQVVPAGRGSELLPVVADAMAACDGQRYSGRTAQVRELDFPDVGDESAAYTIELDGLPIHAAYLVSGDIAIVVSAYDFTGGDPVGLLETYAAKAVDKAADVLG